MQQNQSNKQISQEQPYNSPDRLNMNQNTQVSPQKQNKISDIAVNLETANQIQVKLESKETNSLEDKFQKSSEVRFDNLMSPINAVKNQIIQKIFQHNRNITGQSAPTLEQISKCAQMLQQQFPRMKIDHVVRVLQELILNNCKVEQNIEEQSVYQNSQQQTDLKRNDYSKVNALVRERAAIHVPSGVRLNEQKKIAISYLNHGYGIRVLRHYIKDPTISSTRYNNYITTIMKLAFRRLEEYIKALGRAVVPVNSQDEKVIRAPLTNCQKWLPPAELETFYKFIKLACSLEQKVEINSTHAIKLYDLCIRQLRQRQKNQQNNRNQRIMRGSHRLPRIAQSMYNIIGSYNQTNPHNQFRNSFQNYDLMFYPAPNSKMIVNPRSFQMNNFQKKRLDPAFQNFQKMNVQPIKLNYKLKSETNRLLS